MGCTSSSGTKIKEDIPNTPDTPITRKEKKEKETPFYYCFTEEEKSLIETLKEKVEKKAYDKTIDFQEDDNSMILFRKIELDLKGEESTYKEYFVFYLKDSNEKDKKNTIKREFSIKYDKQKYQQKYFKKNNILQNDIFYAPRNQYDRKLKLNVDINEEDYKNKIIIVELCLKMTIDLFYGLIHGFFYFPNQQYSVVFRYDENYKVGNMFKDGVKRISDCELNAINIESFFFCFRDIRDNQYDIRDKLGNLLESTFNQEEINNLNYSLNNVLGTGTGTFHIGKKIIYDIKPEKVDVTGYLVYLVYENYYEKFSAECEFDYFINEIIINGKKIPKKEYDESLENDYDGVWFYSNDTRIGVSWEFDEHVFLKEFKVEIPNCEECSLTKNYQMGFPMDYGTFYTYEIINNGVSLSKEQFNNYSYIEKDGKIIFTGIYEIHQKDYNDKDYIKNNNDTSDNFEDRIINWEKENEKKLYPSKFEFYPN